MDAAIRYGAPAKPGQVVRMLLERNVAILVAAPSYLQRAGEPCSVAELAAHELIGLRVAGRSWLHWKMFDNGASVRIEGHVRRSADNGLLARLWALDGYSIVLKSRLDVAHDLAAGRLRQVLPDVRSGPYPLVLALAPGAHLNARTRAFGDFLRDRLATQLPPP